MKKFAFALALIFIVPFALVGCGQEEVKLSHYSLDLEYFDSTQTVSGNEVVEYVNTSDNMFTYLLFHLYPNAFREDSSSPVVSSVSENKAYPNGKSYGYITINAVYCEGNLAKYEITGDDENILKVDLCRALYPDESIKINILFEVKLANINHRLGYGNHATNLGNFYPIACVYENGKGFMTSPYHSNGDPFYSETANYSVEITYPKGYQMAASGVIRNQLEKDGKIKAQLIGNKIRDFCLVLSKEFKVKTASVDNIEIKYYYYNDINADKSLQASCDAVKTFNKMIGRYEYSVLNVVETNFLNGGMEYPNLVMISDQAGQDYTYVIVHEIAHQWWYGMVGNDEYNNAWMDEGLTEFSTMLFFEENTSYGENYNNLIKNATATFKNFEEVYTRINGSVDTSMNRALCDYQTEPEYVHCIYTKSVIMFNTLREMVGERKFNKAMKYYFETYKYKNASQAELISAFEKATSYNLEGFFASWLEGKVQIK